MYRPVAFGVAIAVLTVGGRTVVSSASTSDRSGPRQSAEVLVDGWIEALGGMETYWAFQGATFTLTTELYDDVSGRLRRARPRYVTVARVDKGEAARIERWEGDDFIVQGLDGQEAWAVMNGEMLRAGDMDFDEARYVTRDVFYWIALPFKLKDPGVFLHYDGLDPDGRHRVRVTFGEDVGEHDDTWFYTFEEGRSVPVEIAYREEGKDNVNLTYWEDIRDVGGYFVAGRRVHVDEQGRVTKVLVTSDFVLNPEIDPMRFSRP